MDWKHMVPHGPSKGKWGTGYKCRAVGQSGVNQARLIERLDGLLKPDGQRPGHAGDRREIVHRRLFDTL